MVENNIRHNDLIPDLVEVNYIADNRDKFYSIHTMNNLDAENAQENVLLLLLFDRSDRSLNSLEDTNECKEMDYIVESKMMNKIVVVVVVAVVDGSKSWILKDRIFVDVE